MCVYIALIPDAVPESNMQLCFGFTRKEVVGLISTCTVNLKQHEQKQLFSRWKISIQFETVIHSALRIGGGGNHPIEQFRPFGAASLHNRST